MHKVVLIAGGIQQPRIMYKLDAAGTVTRLQDAPAEIELGVNRSIITADPVSGDFIILSGKLKACLRHRHRHLDAAAFLPR